MTAPGKRRSSGCFATIRMTGARANWREPGKPLAGAGVGGALLDGLLRLDAARGLERGGKWRFDFYLEIH
jgi:hypothetical protein